MLEDILYPEKRKRLKMSSNNTTNRYDKYKDSGIEWIGEIPSTKNILRSKYYLVYQKGKNPSILNTDKVGVPYIGASDLDDISGNANYENYTTEEFLPAAQKNDVLILWDGARAGLIGKNHSGVISSTIVNLLTNEKYINKNFLYFYLKGFENFLYDRVNGTTIPHMNRKYIEELEFIDFSLKEQEAIAGYLDRKCGAIDETIEKQKSVIEKLKEYKQSIITQAVTKGLDKSAPMKDSGIEWIGQIPQHWDSIKLKFCSYIRARLGWKGLKAEEYVEEGYPLLSAFNIVNSKLIFENLNFINQFRYDESPEIKLQTNDILLVKDGAGIGKCAIVENMPIPSTANGSLAVISTNYRLVAKFLYYYFISTIFQAYIDRLKDGMGVPHLFQADLKEIQIVLPKEQEQKNIVEFLDKKCSEIDKNIEDKEKLIEKLVEYKKSLIYECVTGKRKVVA